MLNACTIYKCTYKCILHIYTPEVQHSETAEVANVGRDGGKSVVACCDLHQLKVSEYAVQGQEKDNSYC